MRTFQSFQRNLIPVVYTNIQELEPTGQDTCYHLHAYMLNLCPDEYSFFYNFFFSTGEDGLYGNLDFRFVM
ncbi:unnamed protein product [Rhizophagus irregularis]|nr:unnamed protein product [Rhizophagus irregularis]CAB5365052.1 unnamed protein product [Rhizophagus irregularis]